jgi:hypothetical protein
MVFGLRKAPVAGQVAEEPTVADNVGTTNIDEKGEGVVASGIDVDASLDQLKKFKKTHQWVSFSLFQPLISSIHLPCSGRAATATATATATVRNPQPAIHNPQLSTETDANKSCRAGS